MELNLIKNETQKIKTPIRQRKTKNEITVFQSIKRWHQTIMQMQCPNPYTLKEPDQNGRAIQVPCGDCGACRANRRTEWSFRLKEELRSSKTCQFITLTYDEKSLPHTDYCDTGTLVKRDLQLFLKRLRKCQSKYTTDKIRYYAVGEYGTKTQRPHYHLILFNTSPLTLEHLLSVWQLGHVRVDPINDARIHYTTKYHVNYDKKARKGIKEPEFALMSRKPGIGFNYVERTKKWHNEKGALYVVNNGYKQNLPRYLREKIFTEDRLKELQFERSQEADEAYWEERERIEKLGEQLPDKYIKDSKKYYSDLEKRRGGKNDKL